MIPTAVVTAAVEIDRLVNLARTGGPRQTGKAWQELRKLAASGVDLAAHLPPTADAGTDEIIVAELRLMCDVMAERADALRDTLARAPLPPTALSTLALMIPARRPALVPALRPALLARLPGLELEPLAWALRTVRAWLQVDPTVTADELAALIALLGDDRKVKIAGKAYAIGDEAARALVPVAATDGGPALAGTLAARLADRNKRVREGAAYLIACTALAATDAAALGAVLDHRDAAVRRGATAQIRTAVLSDAMLAAQHERAAELLAWSAALPAPRARSGLAEGVADALHPASPPAEVRAAASALAETDPSRRAEAGAIAGLAIDQVDCRWAAPFLATALFDADAGVRRAAAGALAYVFDLTGASPVVRVTRRALEQASAAETDAAVAEELRAALTAATRG